MASTNNPFRKHWRMDPGLAFLNHGSFGACPRPVLDAQQRWRERMEDQLVQFFVRDLESEFDRVREKLAAFLGCPGSDLVWVPNATAGVNAVLRSMTLNPGDELLTTNHEYNACRNALEWVAGRADATVRVVEIPFPLTTADQAFDAIVAGVTPKTRLALLDHITSQTGLVLPIADIVAELARQGVETLVDGAHAPGMLDLNVTQIGAAYYTGNCHKWICAPKGAGFLYVHPDRQRDVRPIAISHAANASRTDRSRFLMEFDWVGTDDPTATLCIADALDFMGTLLPGGWPELRERNRTLALHARDTLCQARGIQPPCPDEMIGSLASIPLPDSSGPPSESPLYADPLQDVLLAEYGIEVPIVPWPGHPRRLVRVSAQIYNTPEEYERLASALNDRV